MKILDGGDGAVNKLLDRIGARFNARLADMEDVAFHFIEQGIHFALVLIHSPDHFDAGLNHLPQNVFLADDAHVIIQIGRRGHRIRQRRDIGQAAHRLQLLAIFEPLLESGGVDAFLAIIHLHHHFIDGAVAQIVKNLRCRFQFGNALAQALIRREQGAAEHTLLGLHRMRRQPIHFERIGQRLRFAAGFFQIHRSDAG